VDDPDWDFAQLEVFRFAPVGEAPGRFFAGYGRETTSSALSPTRFSLQKAGR